jgi:hypothetical protein
MLSAQQKFGRYAAQNVGFLGRQVGNDPEDRDLQDRLRLALTTKKAFEEAGIVRALQHQINNASIDYQNLAKGDVSKMQALARARFPDDAVKQSAFLKEIEPMANGSLADLLRTLQGIHMSATSAFSRGPQDPSSDGGIPS